MENRKSKIQRAEAHQLVVNSYIEGMKALDDKRWPDAVEHLDLLARQNYEDAPTQLKEANYHWGLDLLRKEQFQKAITKFKAAGDYSSAKERLQEAEDKLGLKRLFKKGLIALEDKRYKEAEDAFQQVVNKAQYFRRGEAKRKLREAQEGGEFLEQYHSLREAWDSQNFETVVSLANVILNEVPWHRRMRNRRYREVYAKRRQAKQQQTRKDKRPKFPSILHLVALNASAFITAYGMWEVSSTVLSLIAEILIPLLALIATVVVFYFVQNEATQDRFRDWQRRLVGLAVVLIGILVGISVVSCRIMLQEMGIVAIVSDTTPTAAAMSVPPTDTSVPPIGTSIPPTHTPTITPTSTSPPPNTPTDTPVPTNTPTRTPSPTNMPPSTPYPIPALVSPDEGTSFPEGQDVIKLVWREQDLAENEFFEVRIRLKGEQEFDQMDPIKVPYQIIPTSELTQAGTYEWQVAIVSLSGEEKSVSQIWSFVVR